MAHTPALSKALSFLLVCSAVRAADVNYVFNLQNTQVAPDGFSRNGVIVNGIFPGTLIQANKADTLHITVNDQLTDPTMRYVSVFLYVCAIDNLEMIRRSVSIHWHGLVRIPLRVPWGNLLRLPLQFQMRTASEDGRAYLMATGLRVKS